MQLMRALRAFIAMLAFTVFGVVAVDGVAQASTVPTAYTDCNQSAAYGARVCVDETTGFGPVMYIFSNNGLVASVGIGFGGDGVSPCNSFRTNFEPQGGGDWRYVDTEVTAHYTAYVRCNQGPIGYYQSTVAACWPLQNQVCGIPAWFNDQLEMLSNAANVELVWAD